MKNRSDRERKRRNENRTIRSVGILGDRGRSRVARVPVGGGGQERGPVLAVDRAGSRRWGSFELLVEDVVDSLPINGRRHLGFGSNGTATVSVHNNCSLSLGRVLIERTMMMMMMMNWIDELVRMNITATQSIEIETWKRWLMIRSFVLVVVPPEFLLFYSWQIILFIFPHLVLLFRSGWEDIFLFSSFPFNLFIFYRFHFISFYFSCYQKRLISSSEKINKRLISCIFWTPLWSILCAISEKTFYYVRSVTHHFQYSSFYRLKFM